MAAQEDKVQEGMLGKWFTILWLDYGITPTRISGNSDNSFLTSGPDQTNRTIPEIVQDTNSPAVRFASKNQEILTTYCQKMKRS
jgi:hypothetical protein